MTNLKNALKKQSNVTKQPGIKELINSPVMRKQFEKALPQYMTADRFIRVALTALSSNEKLSRCTETSLLAAMMNSAQLGLEFNTPLGEAYLIPYEDKKRGIVTCNFQIGYKGLLKLAYNTKSFKRITAREVRENEEFSINYGTGEITHKPCLRGNSGEVIGYYALYQTKDGGQDIFYFSKEDAEQYGKRYSKTFKFGPWQDNFDAMAKKSALIQVLKYAPKSTESNYLDQAQNYDNANFKNYEETDNGSINFDVDYEISPIDQKEVPEDIDIETGEILGDKDKQEEVQKDFFDEDFKPIEE